MKAAFYEKFGGPIDIVSLQDPEPAEHGVIVRVAASGLCLSDWHGWMGHDPDIRLPHVPGHELSGTVVTVGKEVVNWKEGDRITVPFVGGCGNCEYCLSGNQQVCDNQFQPGFTAWGSFAEYVAIDYADTNLVSLPEWLGFDEAASLGCRFVTAYRAVKDQGRLLSDQYLAVYGCGGVGLSAIQIAKALGAKVIAVDLSEEKCQFARNLGADQALNASSGPVVEKIRDLSHGGVHLSIDAVGNKETCLNSIQSLRKRGRHVQVGLMAEPHASPEIPMSMVIAHELEILGSHGIQASKYEELFHLIRNSGMQLETMITKRIKLEDLKEDLPGLKDKKSHGITIINDI